MSHTTAHLVGSVNLPDAESTFRMAAGHLGDRLPRIPDGEVGDRFYWIQFQHQFFDATDGLERVGDPGYLIRGQFDTRPLRLAEGRDALDLAFPPLGYADAAIDSYATFAALKAEGVIPSATRFQVSLPTPAGVIGSFFVVDDRADIETVYEQAIFAELDRILEAVPHDQLAIQWDTAWEFGMLERAVIFGTALTGWWGTSDEDMLAGVVDRAARQAAHVPGDVHVGYHLCYGDIEESHFFEPPTSARIADVVSGLFAAAPRPISWMHLPVPIERDDDAYFAPLANVAWPDGTEIYLGLLHHEDGEAGALRRAATAARVVPAFGVATECGFGRGPSDRTASLLDLHAVVARDLD